MRKVGEWFYLGSDQYQVCKVTKSTGKKISFWTGRHLIEMTAMFDPTDDEPRPEVGSLAWLKRKVMDGKERWELELKDPEAS